MRSGIARYLHQEAGALNPHEFVAHAIEAACDFERIPFDPQLEVRVFPAGAIDDAGTGADRSYLARGHAAIAGDNSSHFHD